MINLHPMTPQQIVNESRQKTEAHIEPSLVRESDFDDVPQHSLCYLMQQMLIDDCRASRSIPFEGGGDDEDIPDKAKDPGGEAQAQEEESMQMTFRRPTCFGRPTFGDDDGGMPIQKTPNRRQTSDGVRTSDTSDVRNATDV